jgi:hypothetical protein
MFTIYLDGGLENGDAGRDREEVLWGKERSRRIAAGPLVIPSPVTPPYTPASRNDFDAGTIQGRRRIPRNFHPVNTYYGQTPLILAPHVGHRPFFKWSLFNPMYLRSMTDARHRGQLVFVPSRTLPR